MNECGSPQKTCQMTIGEALAYIQRTIAPSAGVFAIPQSEEILFALTGLNRSNLYISSNRQLPGNTVQQIQAIMKRMLNDEPLPYILGSVYFYNREFVVSPSVLIPRPDTETLVEQVLNLESKDHKTFLDIGTGSGIVACILTELRPWKSIAIDISISALKVARKNTRSNVSLLCSDLFNAIKPAHQFDFIVSNPPYITDSSVQELDNSVKEFEPILALQGGDDGLDFYRHYAIQAADYIRKDGRIYCEIGYDQEEGCKKIFEASGWRYITVTYDLSRHPRVITAKVPTV